MAEIYIDDLINIIKENPKYSSEWENGVPAKKALYIKFHKEVVNNIQSEVYSAKNGSEIVVDLDEKIVCGIEII